MSPVVAGDMVTLHGGGIATEHLPGRVDYVGPTGRALVVWADGCSAVYPSSLLIVLAIDPDAQCPEHGCARHCCDDSHP